MKINMIFVLWPYKIIKSVKARKNAGVKVKLYDIYYAMFQKHSKDLIKPRKTKYKYECFSERQFNENYLKIDNNELDTEYTINFINNSEEDLSIFKLQQTITTESRGIKFYNKIFVKNC